MPLCQRCEQKSDVRGRNSKFGDLKRTTCEFCRLVYEGIIAILSPIYPRDEASATFPPFPSNKGRNFQVDVFIHGIIVSFWCTWGTTCPWGILSAHRDITTLDFDGEGSFNTALDWIKDCVTNHSCSDNISPALPTRVVDTGLNGSEIRIVSGNLSRSRYICLSHCWGQERPLMTTTETLLSYMERIPWFAIPTTFQDAILLSRRLGVQYIWIDSLCIIQDSRIDWETESSKMADIYRNSYITISASASKDSTEGLDPRHTRQRAVLLEGKTESNKPYSIRCQYALAAYTSAKKETPKGAIQHPISSTMDLQDYGEAIPVFPLLTRGWVFQERLLSPRFLQFGRDELLWDCRESMLCECGQRPPDLPHNQVSIGTKSDFIDYKWRTIVEFYCSLNLTYQTDKLPAVSGLARQMKGGRPGANYLAGLWSDSLGLDLLWTPYGPERVHNKEYLAPSWSWACSDRRIIYPNRWRAREEQPSVKVIQEYFELLEASCTASTADLSGRVKEGTLKLRASLFPLTAYTALNGSDACIFRYGSTEFFQIDSSGTGTNQRPTNWRLPFEQHCRRVFLDSTTAPERLTGSKVYSCRLTRIEILEDSTYFLVPDAREVIQIEFSLLLGQIDESRDVFKRIGLLADGRVIDGHRGDEQSWTKEPSCFEEDIDPSQVTII